MANKAQQSEVNTLQTTPILYILFTGELCHVSAVPPAVTLCGIEAVKPVLRLFCCERRSTVPGWPTLGCSRLLNLGGLTVVYLAKESRRWSRSRRHAFPYCGNYLYFFISRVSLLFSALYAKCPSYLVLYMCFICKVSLLVLFMALYAKCPYYLVLYNIIQSVLII